MARGGFRPGAGRPKGSGKKAAKREPKAGGKKATPIGDAVEKVLKATDPTSKSQTSTKRFETALDFAMAAINGDVPDVEVDDKVRLAVAAMPFQHARLADKPMTKAEARSAKAKAGSTGKYAPVAPPGSRPNLVVDNG